MINVHVLYEHSGDGVPHGSSMIRLLQPLGHPNLRKKMHLSFSPEYKELKTDFLIIDRLWKPGVKISEIENIVKRARKEKIALVYSLDDNLLDLNKYKSWYSHPTADEKTIIRFLLREADAVLVSTQKLYDRVKKFNQNITIIDNNLDEKIIPFGERKMKHNREIRIGYMGTFTHDDDFREILPAVIKINKRFNNIKFEIVGALSDARLLRSIPNINVLNIKNNYEYIKFWNWSKQNIFWDIAIAPLKLNEFTECKSDIKFLDYAALKTPGIFTSTPGYKYSVIHKYNGILVENQTSAWIDALELLILDEELRLKLAENANRYLHSQRILSKSISKWKDFIVQNSVQ